MLSCRKYRQRVIACLLIGLLCATACGQQVYFGVNAAANTSYLRNSKYSYFSNEQSRKWLYYPGAEAGIVIGVIPLKYKVSPVFEFTTTYLYRKFGQKFSGYIESGTPPTQLNYNVSGVKKSHDIAFAFLVGVKYKGLRFVTGPVIEKFLKGSINIIEDYGTYPTVYYNFGIGPAYDDYLNLRYYWQFKFSYNLSLKKGFEIAPFLSYVIGFRTQNWIDTGSSGWFGGFLNHVCLGIRGEYLLTLKKKRNDFEK